MSWRSRRSVGTATSSPGISTRRATAGRSGSGTWRTASTTTRDPSSSRAISGTRRSFPNQPSTPTDRRWPGHGGHFSLATTGTTPTASCGSPTACPRTSGTGRGARLRCSRRAIRSTRACSRSSSAGTARWWRSPPPPRCPRTVTASRRGRSTGGPASACSSLRTRPASRPTTASPEPTWATRAARSPSSRTPATCPARATTRTTCTSPPPLSTCRPRGRRAAPSPRRRRTSAPRWSGSAGPRRRMTGPSSATASTRAVRRWCRPTARPDPPSSPG